MKIVVDELPKEAHECTFSEFQFDYDRTYYTCKLSYNNLDNCTLYPCNNGCNHLTTLEDELIRIENKRTEKVYFEHLRLVRPDLFLPEEKESEVD